MNQTFLDRTMRGLARCILFLALVSPGTACAEWGGQGPITPDNPLIQAQVKGDATPDYQTIREAYTGHLSEDPSGDSSAHLGVKIPVVPTNSSEVKHKLSSRSRGGKS